MNKYNYFRIINFFKNLYLNKKYNYLDNSCFISNKAAIWGAKGISIYKGAQIHSFSVLQCNSWNNFQGYSGEIAIGSGTTILPYAYILSGGGKVKIGKECSINPYSIVNGGPGEVIIGDYVRIAAHTVISPINHNFADRNIPIYKQGCTSIGIYIEDDVWIGASVVILDGVKIAKGCVIGAGSVVTKSTKPYGVYVGVPATWIKDR